MDSRNAIYQACLLRFRPIMMTTVCRSGGMPMALGWGAGAELRKPLGIAIVGGLLVSQMLTLFTTPVIYLYLDRLRKRFTCASRAIATARDFWFQRRGRRLVLAQTQDARLKWMNGTSGSKQWIGR